MPYNMPMEKTTRGINFKVFFAIVILVILSVVALPRVCYISGSELSAAKGVGSAINSTIQAEHSDYLNNGNYHSQNPFI